MWIQPQPVTPTVVKIIDAPTPETSVADILIGAVGLVGFVLLAAALVGLVAGVLFFLVRRASRARNAALPGSESSLDLSSPNR
jgi:hypothetical protein